LNLTSAKDKLLTLAFVHPPLLTNRIVAQEMDVMADMLRSVAEIFYPPDRSNQQLAQQTIIPKAVYVADVAVKLLTATVAVMTSHLQTLPIHQPLTGKETIATSAAQPTGQHGQRLCRSL
jgi:phage gp37-like protein